MDTERTCYACGQDDDQCAANCICINCEIDRERLETTR